MKYIANPVEVEAHQLVELVQAGPDGHSTWILSNGETAVATPEMLARITPKVGDYWVIQSDGYAYLNPKEVFERKYSVKPSEVIRPGNPFFGYIRPADKPVVPGLEQFELVYAKDQSEYLPLRTLRAKTERVEVMSRWSPNAEQRKGIAEGADIFLTLLTFRDEHGRPNRLQPITMMVADNPNPDYFREVLNLTRREGHSQLRANGGTLEKHDPNPANMTDPDHKAS